MSALKKVLRKIVPGLFTGAAAVGVATLSISVVEGELLWFGLGAAIRVGLPAFVAGMLFFPVNEKTLASRIGFALRTGFAAFASCVVHRVLWTAMQLGDDLAAVGIDLGAVGEVLRHPSVLLPAGPVDVTAWLALSAISGATAVGFILQPALKRLARAQRPSVASALAQLDATRGRAPAMVRTR
jgi:hypothetical protein